MDEIKDILKCIAIFDNTETDEVKARFFDVIQKDAQKQLKLLNMQNVNNRFLITATIDRKRRYFLAEAKEDWNAIKIFNDTYKGVRFNNIKRLECLNGC